MSQAKVARVTAESLDVVAEPDDRRAATPQSPTRPGRAKVTPTPTQAVGQTRAASPEMTKIRSLASRVRGNLATADPRHLVSQAKVARVTAESPM